MTAVAIKKAVKEAIDEALRERHGDLKELVTEVIEDMALVRAMDAARHSKLVSREQVMRTLRSKTK